MIYNVQRSLALLRVGTGQPDARFREGQEEAIRHIVEGRGRLLVVQRTGWGKSFVYFIATKLLREAGEGPALLVSPLLAPMRNQILAAERMGVRAVTINSDNRDDWADVEASIQRNEVDILLISPERLANERFRTEVLAGVAARIALLVIDEAHCISDWRHDFRPHYRLLARIVRTLPPNLRLLATTATANNRVMDDLRAVLGPNLDVSRGDLNRPSLALQSMRLHSQAERLAWLAEQVPLLPGHGIIYTLTVRDAVQVAGWLDYRAHRSRASAEARQGAVYLGHHLKTLCECYIYLFEALKDEEFAALVLGMSLRSRVEFWRLNPGFDRLGEIDDLRREAEDLCGGRTLPRLRTLAERHGAELGQWYNLVYRLACEPAHVGDLDAFLPGSGVGLWGEGSNRIHEAVGALHYGTQIALAAADVINTNGIGVQLDVASARAALALAASAGSALTA